MSEITTADVQSAVDNLGAFAEGKQSQYTGFYSAIDDVRGKLREASSKGIDIRDLEAQLPELEKKARRREAESSVAALRSLLDKHSPVYKEPGMLGYECRRVREVLGVTSAHAVDVSDLEAEVSILENQARRQYAEDAVGDLRAFAEGRPSPYTYAGSAIDDTRKILSTASMMRIDVHDLESQFPELEKKARRREAEHALSDLRDFVEGNPSPYTDVDSAFINMHTTLQEATIIGVDVSDLRAQLPELEEMATQSHPEK